MQGIFCFLFIVVSFSRSHQHTRILHRNRLASGKVVLRQIAYNKKSAIDMCVNMKFGTIHTSDSSIVFIRECMCVCVCATVFDSLCVMPNATLPLCEKKQHQQHNK